MTFAPGSFSNPSPAYRCLVVLEQSPETYYHSGVECAVESAYLINTGAEISLTQLLFSILKEI